MSHDNTLGAVRPNTTPSTAGTASEIRWVREATIIKRIRRRLALHGQSLVKTREGTAERRENGVYAIADQAHGIFMKSAKLDSLARALGVLADDEMVDPPMNRGWRYYIGRQVSEDVGDKRAIHVVRITKSYTTPAAAWKAAEGFEGDDLIEVGCMADRQEGRHDAR